MNKDKFLSWKLFSIVMIIVLLMTSSFAKEKLISSIEKNELKNMASLIASSKKFQEIAANNYADALLTLSKGKGMQKLHTIDKTIWDVEICQIGWKLFFDTAIRIYTNRLDKYPLVAYYNPFSDTYLITMWAQNNERYKIVDAEFLMGDFVRGSSKEFDNTPFWMRAKEHNIANLGISIALSTMAFEEIFENATIENWRKKLKILNDANVLENFNYPNIAISLHGYLIFIGNFLSTTDNDLQLQECNYATENILKALKTGTIDKILDSANETPLETVKALRSISPKWVENLTVTAGLPVGINNRYECLVILTPRYESSMSMSFLFKDNPVKNQLQLNRIDLIDYQQFYNAIKAQLNQKQKEVL